MSKSFKVIISVASLFLGSYFVVVAPSLLVLMVTGHNINIFYPSSFEQIAITASLGLLFIFVPFLSYCLYKTIKEDSRFFFTFLNVFGFLGFVTIIMSVIF